jgi:hypothetical protein
MTAHGVMHQLRDRHPPTPLAACNRRRRDGRQRGRLTRARGAKPKHGLEPFRGRDRVVDIEDWAHMPEDARNTGARTFICP